MRTVAFSNAAVVKLLNEKFVCAWVNKRPDLKFRDDLYPAGWKPRNLPNGTAVANVTSVFAAGDGTVIAAMPGYLDTKGFKREVEFAMDLHQTLFDPSLRKEDRPRHFARAHERVAKEARDPKERRIRYQVSGAYMTVFDMPLDFFVDKGCDIA